MTYNLWHLISAAENQIGLYRYDWPISVLPAYTIVSKIGYIGLGVCSRFGRQQVAQLTQIIDNLLAPPTVSSLVPGTYRL